MDAYLCHGFSSTNWKELSKKLDQDERAWIEAIGVFERRTKSGFVSALINASIQLKYRSFIETLQSFREKFVPPSSLQESCDFPKGKCIKPTTGTNEQFRKFLNRSSFGGAFYDDDVAKLFIGGIRNGILHDAETRKWVIRREEPEGKIIAKKQDGYVLNRTLFYKAITKEFEIYLRELHESLNKELRARFRKKMQDVCKEA